MADSHVSYVCQQCKQPLQLDKSLEELSPSAYDMIAASLPQPSTSKPLSPAEKLARVPAPAGVKAVWSAAAAHRPSAPRSATSPPDSHPSTALSPTDSFVVLQDSVMRSPSFPAAFPAPTSKHRPKPSKRQTAASGLVVHTPSSTHDPSPGPSSSSPPAPRTQNIKILHKLFDLISSKTDLDHPLCSDCTHSLIDSLSKQLDEARKERDGYIAFEKDAKREAEKGKAVQQMELGNLEKLKADEKAAVKELKDAEAELNKLNGELAALEAEEAALTAEEEDFWASYSATQLASHNLRMSLSSLQAAISTSQQELQILESTNVWQDAFLIAADGPFGTINGLRLGRTGAVVVDWAEINAAWGQTVLLLHSMARKLSFTFEGYTLHPMGSYSRIQKDSGDSYELYASTDMVVTRLLHNRRFDFAMVAFLECVRQMGEHVKKLDASVRFQFVINKDKCGDVSVKLQLAQEEAWTKALRNLLMYMRKLLRWVGNVDD